MKISTILMPLAGVIICGCDGGSSKPAQPTPQPTNAASNPLLAPVDYLGAAAKAQKSAGQTLSSAGLTQAIRMFEAQQGRFPKTLDELVPSVIAKIPAP